MSDSSHPTKPNLEFLRKEAKALLKRCRSGDGSAIARVRASLPRLSLLDDPSIAGQIQLADVHHAMARERGYNNWAALRHEDSAIEGFLMAVRSGALKETQLALAALPDIAEENIHAACAIGDPDAVARHLDFAPELLTAEHRGWPPLFYACASPLNRVSARQSAGILETVRLLLDRGASANTFVSIDPADPESRMPALRRAMLSANMPVLRLLLQRGADRDSLDWPTPFSSQNPRIIDALGEYFGLPQVQQQIQQRLRDLKETPDHWNAGQWWVHMRPPETPPMATPMLRSLLERGGLDPNKVGSDGSTILHRAVQRGPVEVVDMLLSHGADLHKAASDGRSPLVMAMRAGQNLIVDLLRAHGATDAGLNPYDEFVGACMRVDSAEAHRLLNSHPNLLAAATVKDTELLVEAAAGNILSRARLMLECGFDPGQIGEGGFTPLHAAAWHGHLEMVRLLLEYDAPVDIRDATYGSSPMAWAAHGSRNARNADEAYRSTLTALFEAGADYDSGVSRSGVRPEDLASESVALFLRERRL